jgi:hypothetical protein
VRSPQAINAGIANARRQMIAIKAIGIRLSGNAELAGITLGLFAVEA